MARAGKRSSSGCPLLDQALALDAGGREAEAIPLYRRAIARGLSGEKLHTALVCLGSSLRTVGQAHQAVRVLQRARKVFPGDVPVILFLALAHWDNGQRELAIRQLGDALIKESKQRRLASFRGVLGRKYHRIR